VGINEEIEPFIILQHWKTTQKTPFPQVLKKELGKVFFQSDLKSNLNYNIECTSNSIQQ
jgi:hypothetical protein